MRDAALDLTDYCARRLAALHSKAKLFRAAKPAKDAAQSPGDFARSLEKRSAKEELDQQSLEIEFSASVSCVALVRMVVEHLGELTVAGMSRLLHLLLPLVHAGQKMPTTKRTRERWTAREHELFLDGLERFGKKWKLIKELIPTKTVTQVRTHANGHFSKMLRRTVGKPDALEVSHALLALRSIAG